MEQSHPTVIFYITVNAATWEQSTILIISTC